MIKIKCICILIFAVFIIGCNSQTESKQSEQERKKDTNNKVEQPITNVHQSVNKIISDTTIDLGNRVFEFGSATHLNKCTFYFECDCCSGEFIFKPDFTFYYIDHCMGDIAVTSGTYHIKNDYLYLSSDSIRVQELYNWEHENDTAAIEYILADSIINPYKIQFAIDKCESKIKLVDVESQTYVAISCDKNQDSIMTKLKEKGIIKRFVQ